MLDRTRSQQRKFKRIRGRQLSRLLEADVPAAAQADAVSNDEAPEDDAE